MNVMRVNYIASHFSGVTIVTLGPLIIIKRPTMKQKMHEHVRVCKILHHRMLSSF